MPKLETAKHGEEPLEGARRPRILVGVTSSLTCVVLPGRVRALREAGFHVFLLSAPGELLERTAASEGVASFAIPMERVISPLADSIALTRIWRLLRNLKPDIVEFSTPKAGLLGDSRSAFLPDSRPDLLASGTETRDFTGIEAVLVAVGRARYLPLCPCGGLQQPELARSSVGLGHCSSSEAGLAGCGKQ